MKDQLSLPHQNLLEAIELERLELPPLTLRDLEKVRLDIQQASPTAEITPDADDINACLT